MERRHLAHRFIPWLIPMKHRPRSFRAAGPRMAGRAFAGTDASLDYLTVIAWNEASSIAAENRRLALLDDAGRTSPGMGIGVFAMRGHTPPPELDGIPGSVISWLTRGPDRASGWAAGFFRRGRVTWEIVVSGRDVDLLVRIVMDLATNLARREPAIPADGGTLWDLLPVASDLDPPVTLETTFEDPMVEAPPAA